MWEITEAMPPFFNTQRPAERWPLVSNLYPPWLHEFLFLCSEPAQSRPSPKELLETLLAKKRVRATNNQTATLALPGDRGRETCS
ncbi:hypothetical protein MVEN_01676400 [Mycena venus]|uniref:Uncharacterized protein n=1 Tax=Mycena venus TaxID=2733690 RepID=A0A8H6XNP1_9AGAR|nr:hypothetical protein MVEN_01676400 [Mycena venus]